MGVPNADLLTVAGLLGTKVSWSAMHALPVCSCFCAVDRERIRRLSATSGTTGHDDSKRICHCVSQTVLRSWE